MRMQSSLWVVPIGALLLLAGGLLMAATNDHSPTPPADPAQPASPARRTPRAAMIHLAGRHSLQKAGWTLTFHDEFSGSRLNRHNWIDSYPNDVRTHSNAEQEYYATDGYDLKDGHLRLIARNQPSHGMPYTSGMITSYGKFSQRYGWFEIRAKFPRGKGYWPAFWLLPDSKAWPPEIDILEILGHEPDKVYLTNHFVNAYGQHEGKGGSFKGPDFSADFHTFAIDWEPNAITWYVDGVQRFQVTQNVPAVPMYVLANLAVGGDWPGNPDATTPFPGYMVVDYIRVYQKAHTQA